ncbi:hypothetical protein FOZ62_025044, partial [Perkinsus olseni]
MAASHGHIDGAKNDETPIPKRFIRQSCSVDTISSQDRKVLNATECLSQSGITVLDEELNKGSRSIRQDRLKLTRENIDLKKRIEDLLHEQADLRRLRLRNSGSTDAQEMPRSTALASGSDNMLGEP